MKQILLTITFVFASILAFGQSDTTELNTYINTNFPDNTSGFITPERLRNVAKELMRSSANLQEINVFSEPLYVQDTVKSTVGFFAWDGSEWTEVGDLSDTAVWSRSGGFILPLEYGDKLSVDTARFGGLIYPATNGDINIGTNTLKFDTVFADVFDGISAPWAANGDSVYLGLSARVGIGTSSPQYPLRVSGIGYIDTTVTDFFQFLDGGSGSNGDVLTRLTDGVAHWQDPYAYGEMGFADSSYTLALTQSTPAWVTNTANDIWSVASVTMKDVTYSNDSIIVGVDGTYFISGHLSVEGNNRAAIKAYTYKNGSVLCACVAEETLDNNDIITLTIACDIAPLLEGDVITVWVENTASNDDVDLVSGKLTIHRIAP